MTSPLQRIAQHVRHARRCASLARAAAANGNPITADQFRVSVRGSIDIARTIKGAIYA